MATKINLFGFIESDEDLSSKDEGNKLIEKENEYMNYISTHVDRVIKAYERLRDEILVNEGQEYIDAFAIMNRLIGKHDESKYSDDEFDAYRAKFYPVDDSGDKEEIDEAFEAAWRHHYQNNPHHPEYWYDFENKTIREEMPLHFIIEMIADWMSFGDNTLDWWNNSKEGKLQKSIILSPNTIKTIEYILNKL